MGRRAHADYPPRTKHPFACWCLCYGVYDFLYLYGPSRECERLVAAWSRPDTLFRGGFDTLAEAQALAQSSAEGLREYYQGFGHADVYATTDYRFPPENLGRRFNGRRD